MILITGATGQLGRLVIDQLLTTLAPTDIVAAVRSPAKAADLQARGVHVRQADYDEPGQWDAALLGVTKVLLISAPDISTRQRQHQQVVKAIERAGSVRLIAYTSILRADISAVPFADADRHTESLIAASGIPYTFLRHSWYTDNYTMNAVDVVRAGALFGCARRGRISGATRADYAAAAAAVLTHAKVQTIHELGGDHSFSLEEVAAEISRQSGKPVTYVDLPVEEYARLLMQYGLTQEIATALAVADQFAAEGWLHDDSHSLSTLIGRPTTRLEEAVRQALAEKLQ